MSILHIVYPEIPPTSNKLYFQGTRLTTVAREYAERFSHFMATNHLHEVGSLNPHGVYELSLHFYFESVINETWNNPTIKPSKRAKSRYKRMDLSNRIKLIEDCVRDFIAIDDSQTFEGHQVKFQDPRNPRVEIFISETKPELYGVPPEVRMG
jgi:Holliday junction resolvase RusA-like endonuclease